MKCKRTDLLTANVRRETIPAITDEQYKALLSDEDVDVSVEVPDESGEYLIRYHYAEEVE
jgi:hypothetical protein